MTNKYMNLRKNWHFNRICKIFALFYSDIVFFEKKAAYGHHYRI